MKSKLILSALALLSVFSLPLSPAHAQDTAISYSGELKNTGVLVNGDYDVRFGIYDASEGGTRIGPLKTNAVSVKDGRFSATVDFGESVFTGEARWLEVGVRPVGIGSFSVLSPRQQIMSLPHAIKARSAGSVTGPVQAEQITGELAVTTIPIGSIELGKLSDAVVSNTFWRTTGNAGTTAANFLGTTDDRPLEFRIKGQLALRIEPGVGGANFIGGVDSTIHSNAGPSVIMGGFQNSILTGSLHSVIAGGDYNFIGASAPASTVGGGSANQIFEGASFATISGGYSSIIETNSLYSTIGGGQQNSVAANSSGSTIAGGIDNNIGRNSTDSFIGGGQNNAVSSNVTHVTIGGGLGNVVEGGNTIQFGGSPTIAGGVNNRIEGNSGGGAIGGGSGNIVGGLGATVPGGEDNQAKGIDSFAAGRRARALHASTFVWSDFQPPNSPVFASTSSNQFLIRALGGVGIGTNNPQSQLHVRGTVTADAYVGDGSGLSNVTSTATVTNPIAENLLPATVARLNTNQTFIGNNIFSSVVIATNGGNQFGGQFNGVLSGNGAGLTNLSIGSLAGVAFVNSNQTFTASNSLTGVVVATNANNQFTGTFAGTHHGNGAGLTALNASQLTNGLVPDSRLAGNVARTNQVWLLGGNAGTTSGINFLGTGDDQPLELRVNGQRALRLEPNTNGAPNVIGGALINYVPPGVIGATIGGGGATNYFGGRYTNSIRGDFGVVGGGILNNIAENASFSAIAGGYGNDVGVNSSFAIINGGLGNKIADNSFTSVIGGGNNQFIAANSSFATIAGGSTNYIGTNSYFSAIGGGSNNIITANATYATIPGGRANSATNFAFAAGNRAKANHTGAFVWADSQAAEFASSGANQFLIRASGGVAIGKTDPASALDVNGTVTANGFQGDGSGLTNLSLGAVIVPWTSLGGVPAGFADGVDNDTTYSAGPGLVLGGTQFSVSFAGNGVANNASRSDHSHDATSITSGTLNDGRLSSNVPLRNGTNIFTGTNVFAGVLVATNGGNQINGQFTGNGAGLTNLNVGNLAGVAYVGSNQTFTASNTFSGVVIATNAANQLSGTFTGTLAGNGVGLTNLNASNLTTGTVPDLRLSANVSLLGSSVDSSEITDGTIVNADINAAAGIIDTKLATIVTSGKVANSATTATASNAANAIVTRDGAGNFAAGNIAASFVGNGLNLTNLNASNLSTGTIPDGRLSNNLARLNVANTFTAPQTITNAGQVPLQVLGNDVGGTWIDLGNSSLGGRTWNFISSGISNSEGAGKLLFRDTAQGVIMTLSTNGNVGIGITSPGAKLEVVGTLKATAFLGSLSATNLGGGTVSSAVSFTNLGNSFVGNGTGLTNVNAETLDGLDSSAFWGTVGNSVAAGQFLGSVNNQAVEFRVNNARALRLEPNGTSPNVIGGNFSNTVGSNAVGATIAGGGRTQDPNRVSADYGTVGGGRSNTVYGIDGTVSGGFANLAGNTAAVVGGGWINSASGAGATIGGGYFNSASTNFATVGGGATNYASARFATVGGGTINLAWGDYTTIGGGLANFTTNLFATIGGGNQNQALGNFATVAGGFSNEANGTSGSVGGGDNNKNHSLHATIAGGNHNTILGNATGASVGGGAFHLINSNAFYSVIGGGAGNVIRSNLSAATIAGGEQNFVGASYSFIAGGAGNTNLSFVGSISGGALNRIEPNSSHAAISGGEWNLIEESATAASIGGGKGNVISTAATAAVISGGESNQVFGLYATVAGGRQNSAQADYSFAAGWRAVAKYPGSFVWADSTGVAFESSNPNQFLVRAGGGVGINTDNPGSSLEVNGGVRARGGSPGGGGGNNNGYAFSGNGGDSDSGLFSSADGQLEFYNNAQERVRITSLGKVGIGTNAPDALLHVKDSGQDVATLESSATGGTWTSLRNTSAGGKDWRTISTGSGNGEGAGKLLFFVDGARRFEFRANGDFITTGTVNPPSDRNVKRDFAPADAQSVLEKVARLPIQTWAYTNDATIRHIGPVAQDFHAAFGLGTDDKHIATVDADGVALVAIQGLNQKVDDREAALRAEIAELKRELSNFKKMLTNQKLREQEGKP